MVVYGLDESMIIKPFQNLNLTLNAALSKESKYKKPVEFLQWLSKSAMKEFKLELNAHVSYIDGMVFKTFEQNTMVSFRFRFKGDALNLPKVSAK